MVLYGPELSRLHSFDDAQPGHCTTERFLGQDFFAAFSAFFSFLVFNGFFLVSFFFSMPFAIVQASLSW